MALFFLSSLKWGLVTWLEKNDRDGLMIFPHLSTLHHLTSIDIFKEMKWKNNLLSSQPSFIIYFSYINGYIFSHDESLRCQHQHYFYSRGVPWGSPLIIVMFVASACVSSSYPLFHLLYFYQWYYASSTGLMMFVCVPIAVSYHPPKNISSLAN